MAREAYRKILQLVLQAAQIARDVGIPNLFQPGLVKEMILADILGHQLITTKHAADACNPDNSNEVYEYLSCKEGGTGQFDRMFKEPKEKREESLDRIRRNHKVYYAVFYKVNQTKVKIIYELDPSTVVSETERQLDRSKNAISHVNFPEAWVQANGRVVFKDE
jgi:hypothetical protein